MSGENDSNFNKLMKAAPNAKYYVLLCSNISCTNNFQTITTIWSRNEDTSWLIDLKCTICKNQWSICCECANVKTGFATNNQIKQHQYTYHNPNRPNKRKKHPSKSKIECIDSIQVLQMNNKDQDNSQRVIVQGINKEIITNDAENILKPNNVVGNIIQGDTAADEMIVMNEDEIFEDCNEKNIIMQSVNHNNCYLENLVNIKKTNTNIDTFESNKNNITTDVLEALYKNTSIHKLNDKTSLFYSYDLKSSGKKYLVSKMIGNISDTFTKISNDEVNYQINMSRFVSTLTIRQQSQFALLLNDFNNVYGSKNDTLYNPVCRIPKNLACLRRMYTEGENAIDNHLPVPECIMIDDHSYVSILDCIADTLLRNTKSITSIEDWDNVLSNEVMENDILLFRSRRIRKIILDASERVFENMLEQTLTVVPIFISLWSDDFDPNRSIKANRQSVWIKTCTVFFMDDKGERIESTYPIALSTKGSNHEVIESRLKKEIELLQSGKLIVMYSRSHKNAVYVHGDIFCIMNDQPERRGNLKLANGNSICHGRFGFILDCKQKKKVIKSCVDCTRSIESEAYEIINEVQRVDVNYEWRDDTCIKCSAWMYNMNNKLLSYKPDKDYPAFMTNDEGEIHPQQITKKKLETAITFVHDEIQKGALNNAKAKSILKYNGINREAQEMIVECANNYKKLFDAYNNKTNDPDTYISIQEDYRDEPIKFQKYTLPSAWYHFPDLNAHVDVPMHLLMLGVVKSVMLKIGIWLRFRSQKTMFLTMANNILGGVKALNVEWCKILQYPTTDKFGGWISENFLAMTRLGNWFYSLLDYLPETEIYIDPETPHNKWNKIINQQWLEARGLCKEGKAGDLRNRVAKYFEEDNIPQIIMKNECKKENVLELVRVMCCMIQMLMSYKTKQFNTKKLEAVIRLFLIKYDKVDGGITEKETPSWITQYNFLCLLNLPELINNYGNVRNLWEGGTDGEGFLKRVKNELKPGLVNQWQRWSLVNLLQDKIYADWIQDKNNNENNKIIIRNECKVYSSRKKALEEIESGKPFSGVMITDQLQHINNIYVCYRKNVHVMGIKMSVSKKKIEYNGNIYNPLKATRECIEIENNINNLVGIIFLPKLNMNGYEIKTKKTKYCIIKSDWT